MELIGKDSEIVALMSAWWDDVCGTCSLSNDITAEELFSVSGSFVGNFHHTCTLLKKNRKK